MIVSYKKLPIATVYTPITTICAGFVSSYLLKTANFQHLLCIFIDAITATTPPVKKLNLKCGDKLTPPFYQAMLPYFVMSVFLMC